MKQSIPSTTTTSSTSSSKAVHYSSNPELIPGSCSYVKHYKNTLPQTAWPFPRPRPPTLRTIMSDGTIFSVRSSRTAPLPTLQIHSRRQYWRAFLQEAHFYQSLIPSDTPDVYNTMLARMHTTGLLAWRLEESQPTPLSGNAPQIHLNTFSITNNKEWDRLISWPRVNNALSQPPPPSDLSDPSLFSHVHPAQVELAVFYLDIRKQVSQHGPSPSAHRPIPTSTDLFWPRRPRNGGWGKESVPSSSSLPSTAIPCCATPRKPCPWGLPG